MLKINQDALCHNALMLQKNKQVCIGKELVAIGIRLRFRVKLHAGE
jgi:hypothetical protein